MYPRGCGKQERPSALEYRTQSGWYNSRGRPADPFGYGVVDEGKRRGGPWVKGVEKKHGRTDAGGGRTVCGRGRDHVYTGRLSIYRERRLHLCDCMRCPKDGRFLIRSFAKSTNQNLPEFHGILRAVTLLGYVGQAAWHVDREGLHIAAPGIESDFPVVFRLEVD